MDWITSSVFHVCVQVLTVHIEDMNKDPLKSRKKWVFFWPPMNAHFLFNEIQNLFSKSALPTDNR